MVAELKHILVNNRESRGEELSGLPVEEEAATGGAGGVGVSASAGRAASVAKLVPDSGVSTLRPCRPPATRCG